MSSTITFEFDGKEHMVIIPSNPNQEDIEAMRVYAETGNVPLDWYLKRTSGSFSTSETIEEIVQKSIRKQDTNA